MFSMQQIQSHRAKLGLAFMAEVSTRLLPINSLAVLNSSVRHNKDLLSYQMTLSIQTVKMLYVVVGVKNQQQCFVLFHHPSARTNVSWYAKNPKQMNTIYMDYMAGRTHYKLSGGQVEDEFFFQMKWIIDNPIAQTPNLANKPAPSTNQPDGSTKRWPKTSLSQKSSCKSPTTTTNTTV